MQLLAASAVRSGSNYAMLEANRIEGYVALYGQYIKIRKGFTYDAEQDVYICEQGKMLRNKGIKSDVGYFNYFYRSSAVDCKGCPIKKECCGKSDRRTLAFTAFRNHFERMERRLKSLAGRRMKRLRMSTVEPVFGSLINYFGLKRVKAKGKNAAHKCMVISAAAYNLKKYIHFSKPGKAGVKQLALRQRMARNFKLLMDEIWMIIKLQTQIFTISIGSV